MTGVKAEAPAAPGQAEAAAAAASDQENADPTESGSLRKMFVQGSHEIATHRTDNLFHSLEQRTLTEEEQKIIEQRVALQRRMFEEYERRERVRKVAELREVCPDISEEEAGKALELCDGREDEAAAQLVSDPAFKRRVKAACGLIAEPAAPPPARKEAATSRQHNWQAKPAGPRPKLIDPATLAGNVFVGAFRGKGFKPPPKSRSVTRRAGAGAAASSGGQEEELEEQDEQDEEQVAEEAGDQQQQQQEEQKQEQDQEGLDAQTAVSQQEQDEGEQGQQGEAVAAAATGGGTEQQQQREEVSDVLVWPGAQQAAAPAAEPQRYVLVAMDTLQQPTDSLLRSARRQLGEPSDSRAPAGTATTNGVEQQQGAEPASAARSRPLPDAAGVDEAAAASAAAGGATEAAAVPAAVLPNATMVAAMAKQLLKQDDGKARAVLARLPSDAVRAAVLERLESMDAARATACRALLPAPESKVQPSTEAACVAEAPIEGAGAAEDEQAATAQRGRSRRAAAGARRAIKRAASADVSDDDVDASVEAASGEASEASSVSTEEMGESSSDEEFAAPPRSTRRNRRAPAEQPKPRASRPTRAAKQAATASLAAFAADSDEDGAAAGAVGEDPGSSASDTEDEEAAAPRQRHRRPQTKAGTRAGSTARRLPAKKKLKLEQTASAAAAAAAAGQSVQAAEPMAVDTAAAAAAATPCEPDAQSGSAQQPAGNQQQQQHGASSKASPPTAQASDGSGAGGSGGAEVARLPRVRAISSTGHTCRGRVKQKSHKSADLVEAGTLRAEKGWFNAGYIFPEGFHSRTLFRSSVAIDQLCVHECYVMGKGGQYWPQPTFKVVALDRPDEPLIAKSCTGCWTGILKRINAEIEARRKAGEDLPPPPKTAIAGPEYFGFNQPNIQEAVEALDPEHRCTEYWAGKQDRQRAAAGLPVAAAAARPSRPPRPPSSSKRNGGGGGGGSKARGRRRGSDSEGEEGGEGDEDETQFMTNKWSAVSRSERYRKRLQENGEDTSVLDEDNPLPNFIDPITMSTVVRPAISPYGYVAGLATWKVVLAEKQQCPFTNQPLQFEQLKVLTKTNIHLHKDKIVNGSTA